MAALFLVGEEVLAQVCSLTGFEEFLGVTSHISRCSLEEGSLINIKPIRCEFPHMDHVSPIPSVCHAWEFQLL